MVDFGGVKAIVFFPSDAQELVFFWTCASFRPLSVSPLANSTWECPAGLGSGTKLRHRGGQMWWLQPVLKEWQRRTLVLRLALWLSETQGTSGDRPPSGICHWISLTPWWETQRLYNVCPHLSLSLSLHQWLDMTQSPPFSPALQPPSLFSLPVSLHIFQSGLKIDENLLWDYVPRAANNVEEPPGLPLPKQRCNKARSWKIHGYLMETEACELLCYIYR